MIYIVQFDDSASPTGEVVAVSRSFPNAKKLAQKIENRGDHPEKLRWFTQILRYGGTCVVADGHAGEFRILAWKVAS